MGPKPLRPQVVDISEMEELRSRAATNRAPPQIMTQRFQKLSFFDDLRANREGVLSLGFWGVQADCFGPLRYCFRSRWVRYSLGAVHGLQGTLAAMCCGVKIGVAAVVGRRLVIEHFGPVVVHGDAEIGANAVVLADVPAKALAVGVPAHIIFRRDAHEAG